MQKEKNNNNNNKEYQLHLCKECSFSFPTKAMEQMYQGVHQVQGNCYPAKTEKPQVHIVKNGRNISLLLLSNQLHDGNQST